MTTATFDRDAMARWYAGRHSRIDPGVRAIYHLPAGARDREIRLLEVNSLIPELQDEALEPIDFGVDIGNDDPHTLMVLDVTPSQWSRIEREELKLPSGWSLRAATQLAGPGRGP